MIVSFPLSIHLENFQPKMNNFHLLMINFRGNFPTTFDLNILFTMNYEFVFLPIYLQLL